MKPVRLPTVGNYYTFQVLVTGSLVVPFAKISQFELHLNGYGCNEIGSFISTVDTGNGELCISFSVRGLVCCHNYYNRSHSDLEIVIAKLKPIISVNGQEYAPNQFQTTVGGALLTREKPRIVARS